MSEFIVVKYQYGGSKHPLESLENGVLGIPDTPGIQGRKIFDSANPENKIYGVIYDSVKGAVVGIFTSVNKSFHSTKEIFTTDEEVAGENWGHRLHVMSMIRNDKPLPREQFIEMGGVITKGSVNRIPEDTWWTVKDYFAGR